MLSRPTSGHHVLAICLLAGKAMWAHAAAERSPLPVPETGDVVFEIPVIVEFPPRALRIDGTGPLISVDEVVVACEIRSGTSTTVEVRRRPLQAFTDTPQTTVSLGMDLPPGADPESARWSCGMALWGSSLASGCADGDCALGRGPTPAYVPAPAQIPAIASGTLSGTEEATGDRFERLREAVTAPTADSAGFPPASIPRTGEPSGDADLAAARPELNLPVPEECQQTTELLAVSFDHNEHTLDLLDQGRLQSNLSMLLGCRNLTVRIEGFAAPGERQAEDLSRNRAESVAAFYRQGGLSVARITAVGEGEIGGLGPAENSRRADSIPLRN